MTRLIPLLLALPAVGCAYTRDRIADFSDMFRVEASIGVGLQADVTVTELAHVGVGSSRRLSGGWRYGEALGEKRVEDFLPLSYVWTVAAPETESVHSLRWGEEMRSQHRCYMAFPGEFGDSLYDKDLVHYWDIEVNVFAGLVGVQVGFSLGEFVDWLLGWFGADIGDDDGDKRALKSFWIPAVTPKDPAPSPGEFERLE